MIGLHRHKIELLAPVRTPDAGGGASLVWAPETALWARIDRLSSTRDFAGDRTNRLRRIAATIRQRTDIALGARIGFDGAVYEVTSIEDDAPGRRITLICEEAPS
ncbi:MAG: head-tail adaptor protein [Pseudomonadota bacterium]